MDLHQLSPWNWFKKEHESHKSTVPVRYLEPDNNYPVQSLRQEIDRAFDHLLQRNGSGLLSDRWPQVDTRMVFNPQLDINETDNNYAITVDVPGIDRKDIDIQIQGDSLIVSGEKKQEQHSRERNYHCMERSYGAFRRILTLPQDCDGDKVAAGYDKGVLTIEIQKNPKAKPRGRRIEISQVLH